uniref:NADH-ubiquinone oxidoreductase chain 1 n=1 Tax=Undinula vulgaris TaxID=184747 RepID=A0A6B9D693_UNDVU|nr:NADH dehydrogenase subunit 1 [Undinula vulgaris]
MFKLLSYIILIIIMLVNVAFVTLLERKILGYSQLRKGPNKVSMLGLLQPFNDAIKLFSKELVFPQNANIIQYFLAPLVALVIVLIIFSIFPFKEFSLSLSLSVIFMYMMMSMNVYPVLISGWSSNSKYALIGSLRSVAQTVSYEVSLALMLMFYLSLSCTLNLMYMSSMNSFWLKYMIFLPMAGIWLISCLAETNRTPFDFAEGESELVSGFNIEYGSLGFALIFMAEYASIIFMGLIFTLIFLTEGTNCVSTYILTVALVFIWVWVRTTFPRYRYDKLMNLAWKIYLPVVIFLLSLSMMLLI